MCDKLVFDLSQEVEGSPNVFVRKDWVNILDNQNQNYSNSQSIIDTSQLSNSNKYMSYRESYLAIPLLMTIAMPTTGFSITNNVTTTNAEVTAANQTLGKFASVNNTGNADNAMGLKNWFGTIIHSMTLDYNGSTIAQQTPFINMWNTFKLMTSLSYQDILSQGAQIGFYPDDSTSFQFFPSLGALGVGGAANAAPVVGTDSLMNGTTNNTNYTGPSIVSSRLSSFDSGNGNFGFLQRQHYINFDPAGLTCSSDTYANGATSANYASLLSSGGDTMKTLWKSYISNKIDGNIAIAAGAAGAQPVITFTTAPVLQISVLGIVKLKHVHSFFNMCPLLKGVFMKITLNLNNCSSTIITSWSQAATTGAAVVTNFYCSSVSNSIGGVNPLMIASPAANNGSSGLAALNYTAAVAGFNAKTTYYTNISVGRTCLDSTLSNISGVTTGQLAASVYLYIPAYTFNPPFEQAILSSPIKQINYTDVYQYQITNIPSNQFINQLITNGIANIKSILILPYYSSTATNASTSVVLKSGVLNNSNTGFAQGYPVFQSPFDPAGTGTTSPLCHISNFNVQISGQNAIYNLQKYNFEQFNNQLYGQNAVNGGLTDGLTSGLVGRQEFDMSHCYYYVNVERMLPVEMGVPKSVQIVGQNMSSKACDYYVFVEYGVKVSIDILTGARV
jgi:hypothetical protein